MKKLTVNIDDDTYRLLKGKLGYEGLSFQKWAEQQIKTFARELTRIATRDLPIDPCPPIRRGGPVLGSRGAGPLPPPVCFANAKLRGLNADYGKTCRKGGQQ
jgi:hypothetical protein